jgi:gluconate 2-dehydrogenase gamma chain
MDRRQSIKALVIGTVSAGTVLEACENTDHKSTEAKEDFSAKYPDRMPEEIANDRKLSEEKFFTDHEKATLVILGDIIIPADEVSGSASQAKVVDFIDFIVNDMPEHQTPMRGGLRWLDLQSIKRFDQSFKDLKPDQQIQLVDDIAYPEKAKPEFMQGVAFFTLMRNLTMSGFYTSEIGVKDIGYMGNRPNLWNGVPEAVLKQYNIAYSEKELKECISFS